MRGSGNLLGDQVEGADICSDAGGELDVQFGPSVWTDELLGPRDIITPLVS